jgi:hypothetical protein
LKPLERPQSHRLPSRSSANPTVPAGGTTQETTLGTISGTIRLPLCRSPPDIQEYYAVSKLTEVYPLAFSRAADDPDVLRPLAKAAEAIQSGEVPELSGDSGRR